MCKKQVGGKAAQGAFCCAGRSGGTVSEGHPLPHHNAVLWGGGDLQTCTGGDAIAPCTPVDAVYVPTELKEKRTAGPLPRLTHA